MINAIDFKAEQVKLLLTGLISQTVLGYDDDTMKLQSGMVIPISFEGELFRNYLLKIKDIRITSIRKLSNKDIFLNGFLYKPHFVNYMKLRGFNPDDTILRINFELIKCNE